MKQNLILIFCTFLILFSVANSFAQESMMTDIDYPFMQKLVNSAKQNYTQVKIKQEQVNVARTTYKSTKYAWFDALSFSYIYNPQNTLNYTSNNSVGSGSTTGNSVNPNLFFGYQAAVTLNLGTLIHNPFNTKIAKTNYNIALLEQQASDVSVEMQVRRLYITYIQAMATVRMRTQNTQDVGTLLTQTKRQFELSSSNFTSYSAAVTAYATANQAKIDAEAAVLIAKMALEEVVGQKLEEIK